MRLLRLPLIGAALLCAASLHAQYGQPQLNPPAPVPYGWGGYGRGGIFGREGGALYGSAQVMNSYGNVVVQQEQARVQREVANQAKVDTKRKAFDEMMYEKANTPAYTEEQEKVQSMTLRRIMNQPAPAEVTSGKAENLMLPFLQGLAASGVQGPPVTLDQNMLAKVNVTSQKGGASIGPLRQGGHLDWPLLLKGPSQQKLDSMIPAAVSQTMMGQLDPKLYKQIQKELDALTEQWRKMFHKEEIDGAHYLEGKHYLESVQGAVTQLARPGASKLFDGSHAARGRTVPELVYNMTSQGLSFAPATPGDEAAYYALHSAMVAYARGSQTDTAFQNRMAPPTPSAKGKAAYNR